jgi:hypothetical protein
MDTLDKIITYHNITQYKLSPHINDFNTKFKEIYNLNKIYSSQIDPTLFIGVYDYNDLLVIKNHKGPSYVVWVGTSLDLDKLKYQLEFISNITYHICPLTFIYNQIVKYIKKDKIYHIKYFMSYPNEFNKNTNTTLQLNHNIVILGDIINLKSYIPHYNLIQFEKNKNLNCEIAIINNSCINLLYYSYINYLEAHNVDIIIYKSVIQFGNGFYKNYNNVNDLINYIYSKNNLIVANLTANRITGDSIWLISEINKLIKNNKLVICMVQDNVTNNIFYENITDTTKLLCVKIINNSESIINNILKYHNKFKFNNIIINCSSKIDTQLNYSHILSKQLQLLFKYISIYVITKQDIEYIKNIPLKQIICSSSKLVTYVNENNILTKNIICKTENNINYNKTTNKYNNKISIAYISTIKEENNDFIYVINIVVNIINLFINNNELPTLEFHICYGHVIGSLEYKTKIIELIKKYKNYKNCLYINFNISHDSIIKILNTSNIGICDYTDYINYKSDKMISTNIQEYKYFNLEIMHYKQLIINSSENILNKNVNNNYCLLLKIQLNKIANSNTIIMIKTINKSEKKDNIFMYIDNIRIPKSNILESNEYVSLNFIDPSLYKTTNYLYIFPAYNLISICLERTERPNLIYNYNILNKKLINNIITNPKKNIKFAVISDEFTFNNINSEYYATYIPRSDIRKINPKDFNFLICESCWLGLDGSWKNEFNLYGKKQNIGNDLRDIIIKFKRANILTIFYNKEDPIHFDAFKACSQLFDIIITTDDACIDKYKKINNNAKIFAFPFTINPRIHNPINKTCDNGVIAFPGSFYHHFKDRDKSMIQNFNKLIKNGFVVDIYDRQYLLDKMTYQIPNLAKAKNRYNVPEEFQHLVKPPVSGTDVVTYVYKKYKYIVNFNTVENSNTMCSRRAIEVAGCGTHIISDNNKALRNIFGDSIIFFDNITESDDTFVLKTKLMETINLKLYYITHLNYTFDHIINKILTITHNNNLITNLNSDICIILNISNIKISHEIKNTYSIFIPSDPKINSYKYKLYISESNNYYDLEYINKFILPIKFSNNNIYITNNPKEYFTENSLHYSSEIYLINSNNTLNKKLFINNNLKTLYTSVFDLSKYNNLDNKLQHIIKYQKKNIIKIILCQWKRIDNLVHTIDCLNKQLCPNFHIHLYIWNNNYSQREKLKQIITHNKLLFNITWYDSLENIGGIGRFVFVNYLLSKEKFDRVIFIDDDQIFENDVIKILIMNYSRNTSYHWFGKKFYKDKNYWSSWMNRNKNPDSISYPLLDYGGTGFMIIDTNVFKHPDFFYFNTKYQFVEDLWMSYFAQKILNYKLYNGVQIINKIKILRDTHEQHLNLTYLKNEFLEVLRTDGEWDV